MNESGFCDIIIFRKSRTRQGGCALSILIVEGRLSDTDFQIQPQDFALERGQVYGSDLLTIQYSKNCARKKGDVEFDSLNEVILVFLLRHSPKGFRQYESDRYIHRFTEYTAESGFRFKPLITTVYVQVDKALERYRYGLDGEHDPELQLLLAMMGDMNDKLVQERLREHPMQAGIAEHMRRLSLDKEVQVALLAEKYYDFNLYAMKHYAWREGREDAAREIAVELVRAGLMTKEEAAEITGISLEELEGALKKQG